MRGRHSTQPVEGSLAYTMDDWSLQNSELTNGAKPRSCPQCNRVGFYGTFRADGPRFYHACKFCGFWQHVEDVRASSYRATAHDCADWLQVCGAPYVWYVPLDEEEYECPYCHETVKVKEVLVAPPVANREHPWWDLPQDLATQVAYKEWWAAKGMDSTFGYLG